MATMRKRYKGWQVDYRIDDKRYRVQVNDKTTAMEMVDAINKSNSKRDLKKYLKIMLDTL